MTRGPTVTVLCGGVGAARFLQGLLGIVPASEVTAVVNTGDDTVLHGLHISPDLDTITYTLSGSVNPATGWGLAGETWSAMDALERFASVRPSGSTAAGTWFGLGDRDLATHLYRTHRLHEGATLTAVTAEVAAAFGLSVRLLPMSDDRVETRVVVVDKGEIGFQEYFVGMHHDVAVSAVRFAGLDTARPAPDVVAAIERAGIVVIAPSNPIVSIGPVVAFPAIADVTRARRSSVVAVSPIVAGAALKGPAARMLDELGHEASVVGVARLYRDLAATLVIDTADGDLAASVEAEGMRAVVTDTVMRTPEIAAALAARVLAAGHR
ncbi:MAG: 2-phospho-L-lactate transferase [Acidimicrobiales bacterium]